MAEICPACDMLSAGARPYCRQHAPTKGNPACPYCYGTGERYWHSDDCADDLCALNGDMHSCAGQMEHCPCATPAPGREHG